MHHLATTLALASSAGLTVAHPFRFLTRAVASFPAGSSWDILLAKGDILNDINSISSEDFSVIDIDLFNNEAATIADLKSQNRQVICYFSAGSQEGWRSDASQFKDGDVGKALDGWPDEKWVNVKSENVRSIMKSRIQQAAQKGCTAVDPDNVDGFSENQDGFGYDKSAYVDYIKFMAQEAAANNMAIGLKNAIDLIPDVVDTVQFAVNEQCHEFSECDKYKPFTDANKAVFNIEYGGNHCDSPAGVKLSILIKPEDQGLNTLGGACASSGETTPQQPASSQPAASAKPAATSVAASSATPTKVAAPTPTSTKSASQPTPTESNPDEEENDDDDEDENEDEDDDEEEEQPTRAHHWGKHN